MSFKILGGNLLFRYIEEPEETEVIIPDGIEVLGSQSFFRSKNLEVLTIPEGVKVIESRAFEYCYELKEITIPKSMKVIESKAFKGCYKLRKIRTDNGVETISNDAFFYCNLNCLTWQGIRIPLESDDAYYMADILKMIYHRDMRASIPTSTKYSINWAMYCLYPDDEKIIRYIQKDFQAMFQYLIDENQWEILNKALHSGKFVKLKNIDELIRYAIQKQNYEMQAMLISYKNQHFGYQDTTDKLKLSAER